MHTTALSTTQSVEHIRSFWQRIWDSPVVNRRAAVQRWRGYGRPRPCNFQPTQVWSAEVLHKIALTKASSAPGIDGWRGDEIKYWPHRAWVAYSELLCRWAGRGTYPRAWQEMRQVQVPKASAEELSGEVSAADLRPIVIMSVLWRVASL